MFDFADKDKVALFISLSLFVCNFVCNCVIFRDLAKIYLISCAFVYDWICWTIYFEICAIEDKKIGWEEFQIMINPPPPPKAPTPHKVTVQVYLHHHQLPITSKCCSQGEGVLNQTVFPLENMSHSEKRLIWQWTFLCPNFYVPPPGRAEGDEPHGHLDTSSWKEG